MLDCKEFSIQRKNDTPIFVIATYYQICEGFVTFYMSNGKGKFDKVYSYNLDFVVSLGTTG